MWNLWKSPENGGSQIPKLYVVGSIPIARSNKINMLMLFWVIEIFP